MIATQTASVLEERLHARARRIHAEMALLAVDVAVFDDCGYWHGVGMRSCAEWISRRLSFSRHDADALLLAGHALGELPAIAEAFSAGEISLDKARMLVPSFLPRTMRSGRSGRGRRRPDSSRGGVARSGSRS
jgi:predicted TIM-barrel enzyme